MENVDATTRPLIFRAFATALLLGLIAIQMAFSRAEAMQVVHPTGNHPEDIQAVQSAVDAGGTILLKATKIDGAPAAFNFGPANDAINPLGIVTLSQDVVIRGEKTRHAATKIVGGLVPLFGNSYTKTEVSKIHFESPLISAMIFVRSRGAIISGNKITGVVGVNLGAEMDYLTEGRGIKLLGNSGPREITGTILIAGNEIEDLTADLSDAIVLDSVSNARVTIRKNTIRNVEASGIFLLNVGGNLAITDNDIAAGPGLVSPISTGNGIYLLASSQGDTYIAGNRIKATNPWADGVFLVGGTTDESNRIQVVHNSVDMSGSYFGGITLMGQIQNAIVTLNRVSGSSSFGIDLLAGDGSPSTSYIFYNDLSKLESTTADVFLDVGTMGNVVIGRDFTVLDLGTGNIVHGANE